MTDSEGSLPQNESDEDIYRGFSEFNFEDEFAKLEGSRETYKQEAINLSEKVKVLTAENEELKKLNEILGKNLSTLLKTAQTEVKRKDSLIEKLRVQVDSFTFTRNNKVTKDICTSTEDLEPKTDRKSECKECKSRRESKRSKLYNNRNSSDNECKSLKEEKKSDFSGGREEGEDCDNERRLSSRESFKHSKGSYEAHNDRFRVLGSPFSRYRKKDHSDYGRLFWENHRDHFKYDSLGKKKHSRRSDDRHFPPRRRHSSERRRSQKEESFERRRSSRVLIRNKSRSRECTNYLESGSLPGGKESSLDKIRTKSSPDDSVVKVKEQINNKVRDSDLVTNGEGIRRSDNSQNAKSQVNGVRVSESNKQIVGDKNFVQNDRQSSSDDLNTKSPLDALYSEMVTSRKSKSVTSWCSGGARVNLGQEKEKSIEDKTEVATETRIEEDWILSFKNERLKESKPMTLYTKRMLRKFSQESKVENGEELKDKKGVSEKEISNVPNNKPEKDEKFQSTKADTEKEPGELTDDENIIESSKEFQEVAKAASMDTKINQKPANTEEEESSMGGNRLFKEPIKKETFRQILESKTEVKLNNLNAVEKSEEVFSGKGDLVISKEVETTKEMREVIEFSPFKNNYKLIEISPIKPPETRVLDVYRKRVSTGTVSQKQVESSIFNLLSSLSGVPIDKGFKTVEKIKELSEGSKKEQTEASSSSDGKHNKEVESQVSEGSKETEKNSEEMKLVSKTKSVSVRKSLRSKRTSQEVKKETASEMEKKLTESPAQTPGETTQFLDFFLLTTSPSKPIIPGEPDNRIVDLSSKDIVNSSKEKSQTEIYSSKSSNTFKEELVEKKQDSKTKNFASFCLKNKKVRKHSIRPAEKQETEHIKNEVEGKSQDSRSKQEKASKGKEKNHYENKSNSKTESKFLGKGKRKVNSKKEMEGLKKEEKTQKRKRGVSEGEDVESKKQKVEKKDTFRKTRLERRSKRDSRGESEDSLKEDISFFEFFKPITKKENSRNVEYFNTSLEVKKSTPVTVTEAAGLETPNKLVEKVVKSAICIETPHKPPEKLKNVIINEQASSQALGSKIPSLFSPVIGSKFVEMTPRRILKNDLTLSDTEDESSVQANQEVEEEEEEISESENSIYDSDSGASDFVDLL